MTSVVVPGNLTRPGCMRMRVWRLYAVVGAVLSLAYFAVPSVVAQSWLYLVVSASSAAALAAGAIVHRPAHRLPWFLFAGGIALWTSGDLIWLWYDLVRGTSAPFPGIADVVYVAGYPVMLLGMHLLVRARVPGRDGEAVLDAAMLTCSLAVVAWMFIMSPVVRDDSLTSAAAFVSLAYPLGDLALVFLGLRLLGSRGSRSPAFTLLVVAVLAVLAADTGYALLVPADAYQTGDPLDAGWLLSYVCAGAAALHPSMRDVGLPQAPQSHALSPRRLAALSLLWVGPALSLAFHQDRTSLVVGIAGACVLFGLVLARMSYVVRDLEKRARREAEVRAAAEQGERMAIELRDAQRRFATMAAHELRTPLTGLVGSLSTLERVTTDMSPLAAELTEISKRQAGRLVRLTEDLLMLASTQQQDLLVDDEVVDVDECLREVANQLHCRDRLRLAGARGLCVRADPMRLTQVLTNLVRNALQHSPTDALIDVETAAAPSDVRVLVRDHGTGIAADRLETIFEQFGHHREAKRTEGLGIGLWIVRHLVVAMGGTVSVHLPEDGGTSFAVTLRRVGA